MSASLAIPQELSSLQTLQKLYKKEEKNSGLNCFSVLKMSAYNFPRSRLLVHSCSY